MIKDNNNNNNNEPIIKEISLFNYLKTKFLTDKINIFILLGVTALLSVIFKLFYNFSYIINTYYVLLGFIFSPPFIFSLLFCLILMSKYLNDLTYNIIVFVGSFIYLFVLYSNFLELFNMSGDNICQVAYWNILFRPHLAGSIGASLVKPGQVVVVGLLYQLYLLTGNISFKIGLCSVMAFLIYSLTIVAKEQVGRIAGVVVFFIAQLAFIYNFLWADAILYFIPVLFTGLWCYFNKTRYRILGLILLVLSIQFNIQSIAILFFIWVIHLIKREWKDLILLSIFTAISLLFWLFFILRVQGSFDRLNSGAAAGYPFPGAGFSVAGIIIRLTYIINTFIQEFSVDNVARYLIILAIFGIIGSIILKNYHKHLTIFAVLIILVLNVILFGGTFNLGRYFGAIYGFACSVGILSIIFYLKNIIKKRNIITIITACIPLTLFLFMIDFSNLNLYKYFDKNTMAGPFVRSAFNLLNDNNIKPGSGLLTEDDILYPIVIKEPDRFPYLAALQRFNVANESERKKILAKTNYIWVSLNSEHGYYYLDYMAMEEWTQDPFRILIEDIKANNIERSIYGYRLIPISINQERLILNVIKI